MVSGGGVLFLIPVVDPDVVIEDQGIRGQPELVGKLPRNLSVQIGIAGLANILIGQIEHDVQVAAPRRTEPGPLPVAQLTGREAGKVEQA